VTDDDMVWNDSKEMLGVSERKMKALTLKMEMAVLIGKRTQRHVLCIKCMKLIIKYFFLLGILFLGSCLTYG
jgi:hypothetical protein